MSLGLWTNHEMKQERTDLVVWNGSSYRTILTRSASQGAMSIVDSTTPSNEGPPRHIHHAEDEIFVVLTGEIEVWIEGETTRIGPGEAGFIPRGKSHTFRVSSDTPSRHLVILTPGGFEQFFYAMADAECVIPDDMPQIESVASEMNLTFTGPPLSVAP